MNSYHFNLPLTQEDIEKLHVGDSVTVSGEAFTCRSRLQRYVFDEGHELPQSVKDRNLLIHVGPIVVREEDKWRLVSFMPTSSLRFEKWGARSIREWGLKAIIGKTTMGAETMAAMKECGCVHLSPQSVSPNLWVDSIEIQDVALFDELGTIEATWHLKLDHLGPFVVDMDIYGNNLFEEIDQKVAEKKKEVMKKLGIPEDFEYTKLY